MTTNPAVPRAAYQRAAVLTASQSQLIVMLYDGANRFLAQAAVAMGERQIETAHNKLRRAEMIITHLQGSLDFEQGGEIAPRLAAIYVFCQRHLNEARIYADPARIEQVRGLLGTLRDAWAQIADA
jgi:flagellar secretion chaperone FliS